ncbi:MAG: hypothetical protein J6U12_03380 [Candidatus Methanomethylophilaceae archaeon]|nr:hypothetical protein [Candidatus Methanomethylophilaceae archaeon]MBP5685211.1 hypothetical protein [Candidatus Methanomethylophilaceae archaeon]MBP5735397.1 hypothetical protein [Candidatus Methanomethylophilaceae archaeon]
MEGHYSYLANYAMGIMLVMSFHLLFEGTVALLFPYLFDTGYLSHQTYQIVYVGLGVLEFIVFVMLFNESGIGYKLAIILIAVILALNVYNIVTDIPYGFDMALQGILGSITLVILLMPSVRRFYNNWSIGELPTLKE